MIFCLKRGGDPAARTPNRLWPYFLVYVRDDGTVRYTFRQAQQCLAIFRCSPQAGRKPSRRWRMPSTRKLSMVYAWRNTTKLLGASLRSVLGAFRDAELTGLAQNPGAVLTEKPERVDPVEDFTLVTWLVIVDKQRSSVPATAGDE